MKELDDKKWEVKINAIKKEKREKCKSIPSGDYGNLDKKGNVLSNKERKKVKEELTKKRRSVKRSQKQEVEKFVKGTIDEIYGE